MQVDEILLVQFDQHCAFDSAERRTTVTNFIQLDDHLKRSS
jgi:hypothetical protein